MTAYAYIILNNSNSSLTKRFRVVADGYDNGTPKKQQSLRQTVGGGIDVSQGAILRTWSPVFRVRHTEPVSDYGTLGNLETFFGYINPNGTPTDKITFTDNHGTARTVIMVGDLRKSLLSATIEGSTAWYLVRVTLQEVA